MLYAQWSISINNFNILPILFLKYYTVTNYHFWLRDLFEKLWFFIFFESEIITVKKDFSTNTEFRTGYRFNWLNYLVNLVSPPSSYRSFPVLSKLLEAVKVVIYSNISCQWITHFVSHAINILVLFPKFLYFSSLSYLEFVSHKVKTFNIFSYIKSISYNSYN